MLFVEVCVFWCVVVVKFDRSCLDVVGLVGVVVRPSSRHALRVHVLLVHGLVRVHGLVQFIGFEGALAIDGVVRLLLSLGAGVKFVLGGLSVATAEPRRPTAWGQVTPARRPFPQWQTAAPRTDRFGSSVRCERSFVPPQPASGCLALTMQPVFHRGGRPQSCRAPARVTSWARGCATAQRRFPCAAARRQAALSRRGRRVDRRPPLLDGRQRLVAALQRS